MSYTSTHAWIVGVVVSQVRPELSGHSYHELHHIQTNILSENAIKTVVI